MISLFNLSFINLYLYSLLISEKNVFMSFIKTENLLNYLYISAMFSLICLDVIYLVLKTFIFGVKDVILSYVCYLYHHFCCSCCLCQLFEISIFPLYFQPFNSFYIRYVSCKQLVAVYFISH